MHFSSIFEGITQTLRKQAVQQHTGNDQEGDSVVVAAGLAVPAFVDVDGCYILEVLRELLFFPHGLEKDGTLVKQGWISCFVHLSRDVIRSGGFPGGHLLDDF